MTLKELVIAKKVRKGEPDGRNKRGAYWVALSVKTAAYGGDGIGQSAADIAWYLEIRHRRDGLCDGVLRRWSWHQNTGTDNIYRICDSVLDMSTIEDILDRLAEIGEDGEYDERYYVDSYHRENVTKALEEIGLKHAKAPDEEDVELRR